MATSSFLEIEKLKNNENAKLTITGFQDLAKGTDQTPFSKLGIVSGYITENTSFQFGHEFSSPSNTVGELVGSVISTAGKVKEISGRGSLSQRILTSAIGTMQNWKGASPFAFTIPTVFVASSEAPEDNPMIPVRTLMQAVIPRFEKLDHTRGLLEQMISPNNYSPGDANSPKGTFSLKLGRWFNASNLAMRQRQRQVRWSTSSPIPRCTTGWAWRPGYGMFPAYMKLTPMS